MDCALFPFVDTYGNGRYGNAGLPAQISFRGVGASSTCAYDGVTHIAMCRAMLRCGKPAPIVAAYTRDVRGPDLIFAHGGFGMRPVCPSAGVRAVGRDRRDARASGVTGALGNSTPCPSGRLPPVSSRRLAPQLSQRLIMRAAWHPGLTLWARPPGELDMRFRCAAGLFMWVVRYGA